MSHQDWSSITWDKRGQQGKNESKKVFLERQKRKNGVTIQNRFTEGKNKNIRSGMNKSKLDENTEIFKHKKVSINVGKKIMQKRCEKNLSQKALAQKINVHVSIIQQYELGKAIPNGNILRRIEKAIDLNPGELKK